MDEIRKIIDEYQAEVEEATSENQRRSAMEYAFNRILEVAGTQAEKKQTRFSDDPFNCVSFTASRADNDDVDRETKSSPAIYVRRIGNREGE